MAEMVCLGRSAQVAAMLGLLLMFSWANFGATADITDCEGITNEDINKCSQTIRNGVASKDVSYCCKVLESLDESNCKCIKSAVHSAIGSPRLRLSDDLLSLVKFMCRFARSDFDLSKLPKC